jgi:ABC-type sugar transport systems, permease components
MGIGIISYSKQKRIVLILFLAVPVMLLALFAYYPAAKLVQLSFTDWNGMDMNLHYVGFGNFIELLKDPSTFTIFMNNMAYIIIMLLQTAMALYLAVILNSKVLCRNFFRSVFFMPYVLNGVAVAFMFSFIYDFNYSPVNVILRGMGLENYCIRWLSDNYLINFSLGLISMWRYTGFSMVIFLGALQSVPNELYESAKIDGANFFHNLRYIAIPSIKRTIELLLFLGLSGAMQAYFEAMLITKGGPAGRSATFAYKSIEMAFQFQNFGKASAMGVILLSIILIIIMIQKKLLSK